MPLLETKAVASAQGYGLTTTLPQAVYIEDVFSTYLYTGTGATQTITNGIDLSTKGGLVWNKDRSGVTGHRFTDTARGVTKSLESSSSAAEATEATGLTAFNSTGFTIGADTDYNTSSATYVAWTFEKQSKFFDVVTYTGTGANRTIAHNLGSIPGCIIVKRTDTTGSWRVYHNSLSSAANSILLNSQAAEAATSTVWNSTAPTSSVFSVGTDATVNASGGTYVAYIFAHNAGGFGLTGTDNVISCGSYTGNGSAIGPIVSLGYEPQWLMIKNITGLGNWVMLDNMRSMTVNTTDEFLYANSSSATTTVDIIRPTATGFQITSALTDLNTNASTYIYIAIRRGLMKTPTTGTSVFGLSARTGTGADATVTGSAGVTDVVLIKNRGSAVADVLAPRLTHSSYLVTSTIAAETASANFFQSNPWDVMDGVKVGTTATATNASANTFINYLFSRAPGFMDVVCYNGTGTAGTQTHNLGVVPEFMIVKRRNSGTWDWATYHSAVGNTKSIALNSTGNPITLTGFWNNTTPTSSVFTTGNNGSTNASGGTYVAYLFATCAGVSKVGSYTGNGSSQTIDCGFTGGARFVLIRRTDAAADWYVWDTARGIVTANDPHLSLNTSAAEVTTDDSIDTNNTGFVVNQLAATDINVSSSTYIFLAIA